METPVVENGIEGWKSQVLPPGEYKLIGWDIDTTGRKLIDDICQIAAYTPEACFSQYVMPFREINPAARQRHNIQVLTIGVFRMLQDTKTNMVLQTKTAVGALTDFMNWLEMIKGECKDGIILISHESNKFAASLLLEKLRKYNMLERFSSIVKGFANGYNIAQVKITTILPNVTLKTLSRVLLHSGEGLHSAVNRARLSFEIAQHLCAGEERQACGEARELASPDLIQAISEFIQTISQEEEGLAKIKSILNRQKSMRPIFTSMLRQRAGRAIYLLSILAESGIDYEILNNTHKLRGEDGIMELLTFKLSHVKGRDINELKRLVRDHFEEGNGGGNVPSEEDQGSAHNAGDETVPATTNASDTISTAPVSESVQSAQNGEKVNEKESIEICSDSDINFSPPATSAASPAGASVSRSQ